VIFRVLVFIDVTSDALSLLEVAGPFESEAFRRAVCDSVPGYSDVSLGATLADGRRVAVALLLSRGMAESLPPHVYGGVRSDSALTADEELALLEEARVAHGAKTIAVRALDADAPLRSGATLAEATIVVTDGPATFRERYSRLARRSLRRAVSHGASVRVDDGADAFLGLYQSASASYAVRYPRDLIQAIVHRGLATAHVVAMDGEAVAGLLTVRGATHWMCWLAAQNARGREVAASYLAYDALFEMAAGAGVPFVNLGASAPGSGGKEFKHHLGGVPASMSEVRVAKAGLRIEFAPAAVARRVVRKLGTKVT
jgi:hypothetical protein